jgi:FkbM family methyltransferase
VFNQIRRFIRPHAADVDTALALTKSRPTIRLGSSYGGWNFVDHPSLQGCTIVSAGLGEDASFDIEFAARYAARVIIVDPTLRAVQHFEAISAHFGEPSSQPYGPTGKQPISAYDLSSIRQDQLQLMPYALWNERGVVKFVGPANPEHVSHWIPTPGSEIGPATRVTEVPAMAMDNIMDAVGIVGLPLLKIDIEGAEVEVLEDCLAKGITPAQILVEFDALMSTPARRQRVLNLYDTLLRRGFDAVHREGDRNFLFVHRGLRD